MGRPKSRHSAFNSLSKVNSTWAHQMLSTLRVMGSSLTFPSPLREPEELLSPGRGFFFVRIPKPMNGRTLNAFSPHLAC